MKKTVLVTGCFGTVGINTINKLLENDYFVIGIDNCSTNPMIRIREIKHSNDNFVYYNNNNTSLEYIFKKFKIDKILHTAGIVGSWITNNDCGYFDSNVKLTFNLLDFAYKNNIERFVYSSSSSVYGEAFKTRRSLETDIRKPISFYALSKSHSEDYVNYFHNMHNLNTVILRYCNVFANMKYYNYRSVLTKFIEKILNNEQITLYNNGISKRQYVFIDNIVFANYLALVSENENINGETFNISVEDNPISLIDLVNILYSKLNKEPNYILSDTKQIGDFDLNWEDISKAKEMLGYKVLVNMEDGITSHIKYKLGQ